MDLLVTGGTGFFGKALLRFLDENRSSAQKFNSLTILSRECSKFRRSNPDLCGLSSLEFRDGDILDRGSLPYDKRFTHILHAAADSTAKRALSSMERFNQIYNGTLNILDLAMNTGATRFLFISSGAIYGPQPEELDALTEESPIYLPVNSAEHAYGVGKLAAEHLAALHRDQFGLEVIIARCFAFIGPDLPLDAHYAVGNFVRDALWGDEIVVNSDGSPTRTYLDQSDLANWLLVLVENGRTGEAYNVGSDEVVNIGYLANLVKDLVAPEKPVRILSGSNSLQARNRYVPNIDKARCELGLDVTTSLAEAIRRTAEWNRRLRP